MTGFQENLEFFQIRLVEKLQGGRTLPCDHVLVVVGRNEAGPGLAHHLPGAVLPRGVAPLYGSVGWLAAPRAWSDLFRMLLPATGPVPEGKMR